MKNKTDFHKLRNRVFLESEVFSGLSLFTIALCIFMLNVFSEQAALAVPGFARQTGMSCSACHYSFPELTAFGRQFKQNGYTLTAIKTYQDKSPEGKEKLRLLSISPVSAMIQSSLTSLNKAIPGTQNNTIELPEQFSLFYAGSITPHLGLFMQLTYDSQSGLIGMDNTDIRYANQTTFASKDLNYGFTLNNNPTVQDLWNSTPAWGFPYSSSDFAPTPVASALIDGNLAQQVAGLGGYVLWNETLYLECSLYRSAQQGVTYPPDSTSEMIIKGVAPYWRVALQHQWPGRYIEAGTYGMSAGIFPNGTSGLTDRYSDYGFDIQYEQALPNAELILHSTYILERRQMDASAKLGIVDKPGQRLNTFRMDGNLHVRNSYGLNLGWFTTTGDKVPGIYGGSGIFASTSGNPASDGIIGQIYFLPWYNTKFAFQYTLFTKFNGATKNYDGLGRNAGDNNTLLMMAWINF